MCGEAWDPPALLSSRDVCHGNTSQPGVKGTVKASENRVGVHCVQLGNEANDPLPQITSLERKHIRNMQQSSSTSSSDVPTVTRAAVGSSEQLSWHLLAGFR